MVAKASAFDVAETHSMGVARQAHAESVMGTVVSIDIREPLVRVDAITAACAHLHDIDRRFSLYRADSELSRLAAGLIRERELSEDVQWVLAGSDTVARNSAGAFDARSHRADGVVDPSALVKGWAIEGAASLLDEAGARNFMIGAGGDVLTRGEAEPGESWRVGIRHPEHADRVAAVLMTRHHAVATSGLYERGDHLRDPRTGQIPNDLISFTVVGPDLTWADAYATAGFVMGLDGLGWVNAQPTYSALAITASGEVVWTEGIDRLLARIR
ncbi:MAG: FAD:protein FMN transferase [Chloroflexota bacterium]